MALIKCKDCGKKFSKEAEMCPNCGKPNNIKNINVTVNEKHSKWSTAKLIIGIISMVLFLLISLQSCAAVLGDALVDNDSTSGISGMMCSFLMLISGIITVTTRNKDGNGGAITALVLYWLAALVTIGTGETYPDLPIWGSLAFIFGLINLGSILAKNETFKNERKTKILVWTIVGISIIVFVLSFSSESNNESDNTTNPNNVQNNTDNSSGNSSSTNKNNKYTLGDTFTFDKLEITIGNEISFTTVDNRYSEYYEKDVVKLPITVKNLKDETHSLNMFYYKVYGSQGAEVDTVSFYFDDGIDEAGDLRSGASYTKSMYFIYDGDGQYDIEFDNWAKKTTVEFNITK